jgi:hypothetical protein
MIFRLADEVLIFSMTKKVYEIKYLLNLMKNDRIINDSPFQTARILY